MVDFDLLMEKHTWTSLRSTIENLSPRFAAVIDQLDTDKNYPLYQIRYPYGAKISDRGIFCIPNSKKELVQISHSSISNEIQNDLGYSGTIPLGIITENGIESFLQLKQKIIPGTFKSKGDLISLWRVLEEEDSSYHLNWTITSGARSICMLPKITDTMSHKALKNKYNLKLPVPQELFDHWEIFKHIANQSNFIQPWTSEIVFFSKKWFEQKKDKKWREFYQFLLDEFWKTSSFRRNQYIFDSIFSIIEENKNLRPNPYLADIVKHLIAIGKGSAPAFSPAVNDLTAPITGFQKTYIEDYGLKKYAPVIMHLGHFPPTNKQPVYYSLQMPTTTIFSPKSRKLSSVMADLQEIKHIMEVFLSEILEGDMALEKTPLYHFAKTINYRFYHSDKDKFGEILSATEIEKIDSNFTKSIIDFNTYFFPEFGPFFRGCISISSIEN